MEVYTVVSVHPALFLVTKEETWKKTVHPKSPKIKPHLKNDPAAVEQWGSSLSIVRLLSFPLVFETSSL